ncbi:MAG: hypothetical protein ACRC6T_14190 [Sarcina sp.]
MIKLFFNKIGSGKSKELMNLANTDIKEIKGTSVFIDNDDKRIFSVDSKIRFISMKEYPVTTYNEFSAFICGVLSNDYDIENMYIDNLSKIIKEFDVKLLDYYLEDLNKLSIKYNVNVFMNVHSENEVIPEKVKAYIA